MGGPAAAALPTTILNENTTVGYQAYDLFDKKAKPEGDIDKAKELLAAVEQPDADDRLRLQPDAGPGAGHRRDQERSGEGRDQGRGQAARPQDLLRPIGKVKNEFDMYWGGWGADWPSGSTVLPVIFGPIADGAPNYSHLKDPAIDRRDGQDHRYDRHRRGQRRVDGPGQEDPGGRSPRWSSRTNKIATMLHGSKVGGAEIDPQQWIVQPDTIFVKP